MPYTRLTNDREDPNYEASAKDLLALSATISEVTLIYLIPKDRFSIAKKLAKEVIQLNRTAYGKNVSKIGKLWRKYADRYNFMLNDGPDDIWMNVKLTIMDKAGIEP